MGSDRNAVKLSYRNENGEWVEKIYQRERDALRFLDNHLEITIYHLIPASAVMEKTKKQRVDRIRTSLGDNKIRSVIPKKAS